MTAQRAEKRGASRAPPALQAALGRLKQWLVEAAYPIWWEKGADRRGGGYFDRLTLAGVPEPGPKRMRVQARQAHTYALAPGLGWGGPAESASRHGLDFIRLFGRRPDGLYWSALDAEGAPLGEEAELYDQAFVLLALASARAAFDDPTLEAVAVELRERIGAFAQPAGGFGETYGAPAPLLANPNMHLFECFQAWASVSADPVWAELAAGQAALALGRLIDPQTGALSETFGADWAAPTQPEARVVEPGHLFEWAWLLLRWQGATQASLAAALRLVEIGERAGIDATRQVAIYALDGALKPRVRRARFWAQTERIKACALAASLTGKAALWDAAALACGTLERFLEVPTPGLWRDWMEEDGAFLAESAPASSFYHVVGAIAELDRLAGRSS